MKADKRFVCIFIFYLLSPEFVDLNTVQPEPKIVAGQTAAMNSATLVSTMLRISLKMLVGVSLEPEDEDRLRIRCSDQTPAVFEYDTGTVDGDDLVIA